MSRRQVRVMSVVRVDKVTLAYNDTFSVSQHYHCNREAL